MEASQAAQDIFNLILDQLFQAVQSSGLQFVIVFCLVFIIQKVKMTFYFLSKRIFLFQLLLSTVITAFYVYFTDVEIGMIPVLFLGYLGLPVFFYYVFKKMKIFKGFFTSNYHFLEEKELERKAKKDNKKPKKNS